MDTHFTLTNTQENPGIACILVLDASASMAGHRVKALNQGLQHFQAGLLAQPELAQQTSLGIVTFGDAVHTLQAPAPVTEITMPAVKPKGNTKLVAGMHQALALLNQMEAPHAPWVVLVTDGVPNYDEDVNGLVYTLNQARATMAFTFVAVGINGADQKLLQSLTGYDTPPYHLRDLCFDQFFDWLLRAMSQHRLAQPGLPPAHTWAHEAQLAQ